MTRPIRIRSLFALAALVVIAPRGAASQPACAPNTLAAYLVSGTGCTVGGVLFSGFTGASGIPATNASLTPTLRNIGGQSFAGFTISFAPMVSATSAHAIRNGNPCAPLGSCFADIADLGFEFDANALVGGVNSFAVTNMIGILSTEGLGWNTHVFSRLGATPTPADPAATASLEAVLPPGDVLCYPISPSCPSVAEHLGGSVDAHYRALFEAAVIEDVALPPDLGASDGKVYLSSVEMLFSVRSVPEPTTWVTVGTGLLLLGGVAIRRRARTA